MSNVTREEPNTEGTYDLSVSRIQVQNNQIPKGARLVEAYETEHHIIVCGEPPNEPEGLTEEQYAEWYETAHNCDAMGCGWSHVLYIFTK